MGIVLGGYVLDGDRTAVEERYEEIGGQDARLVVLTGILAGADSLMGLENSLDALGAAASEEKTPLILREGRCLWVRRTGFRREIMRDALTAKFILKLTAADPCEESLALQTVNWNVTASGQVKSFSSGGNREALPQIALTAIGDIIAPGFTDGTRTISFSETVPDGKTLTLNTATGKAFLEDEEVTPYTNGVFPWITSPSGVLQFLDDDASSHTASVVVTYRDRWW